ncbi:MAG: SOS response-associated peptidase [Alsobacter sp.]
MCGRFALTSTPQSVRALFGYADEPDFPPRSAIAPTEPVGVVTMLGGARRFILMRWGFVPSWAKDPGEFPLLFNARGETLADKPAFRTALRRRRCIFPADAFYEWRRTGRQREPFRIARRDGAPMALAGLFETWSSPDGGEIDTAAIITTTANGTVAAVHERMPVILAPHDMAVWLDCAGEDPRAALALVRAAPDGVLQVEPCTPQLPKPNRAPLRRAPARPAADDAQGRLL